MCGLPCSDRLVTAVEETGRTGRFKDMSFEEQENAPCFGENVSCQGSPLFFANYDLPSWRPASDSVTKSMLIDTSIS